MILFIFHKGAYFSQAEEILSLNCKSIPVNGSVQWAVGSIQWAVGSGQWGSVQWAVGSVQYSVGSGAVFSGQLAVGQYSVIQVAVGSR
ncbi:MAG: hypothetical protein MI974_06460 [Chitinophagales bacterium]|nr:hypothetical protein [Chitinophagales bacterium]